MRRPIENAELPAEAAGRCELRPAVGVHLSHPIATPPSRLLQSRVVGDDTTIRLVPAAAATSAAAAVADDVTRRSERRVNSMIRPPLSGAVMTSKRPVDTN